MNHGRGLNDPELELLDTGVFDDDRYWSVDVTYAKASPTEVLMRIELENHGPDEATLARAADALVPQHVVVGRRRAERPRIEGDGTALVVADHRLAGYRLEAAPGPDGAAPEALFCENESNAPRVFGSDGDDAATRRTASTTTSSRAPTTVNPEGFGTKAALRYRVTVAGGGKAELRLRAAPARDEAQAGRELGGRRRSTRSSRRARPTRTSSTPRSRPTGTVAEGCSILRQACAGPRLEQADVPVQRPPLARRRPGRAAAARASRSTAATTTGGTSTRSTCSRCRTRGSTRGSRRGTSASTASPGRTSIRRSRSTSSSCCSASGSSTRTAPCRRTSGTSTTSTRRCT